MDNDVEKMTTKIFKIIVLAETTVIALGALSLMLIRDYRSGLLDLSDPIKATLQALACLAMLLFFILGSTGWMILITLFYEDRKHDRNDNGSAPCGSDMPCGSADNTNMGVYNK